MLPKQPENSSKRSGLNRNRFTLKFKQRLHGADSKVTDYGPRRHRLVETRYLSLLPKEAIGLLAIGNIIHHRNELDEPGDEAIQ